MKRNYFTFGSVIFIVLLIASVIFPQTETAPTGTGTSADPYLISSVDNLAWLQDPANKAAWGSYFKQTANIDASSSSTWNSGSGFAPIGPNALTPFSGVYDGGGFTITGITISRSTTTYIGMFGYISSSPNTVLKNLGLVNVNVTGKDFTGGLIGWDVTTSAITNCYVTGKVTGNTYVGGLAGFADNVIVSDCYDSVIVKATSTTNSSYCGGLVGDNTGGGTIENCYSTGGVAGIGYTAGLAGANANTSYIHNSYSTDTVYGTGTHVGGFVGLDYKSFIDNSYSIGHVGGAATARGFIGDTLLSSVTTNCFWDTTTSGKDSSSDGTGKSTAEMKTLSTYTDTNTVGLTSAWDFVTNPNDDTANVNIWDIDIAHKVINNGYPFLSWQNGNVVVLPVELTTFTASTLSNKVELNWNTATELNNSGFEVDRKLSNQSVWENIGFVRGLGNSTSIINYNFIDNNPVNGTIDYRLKQIDNNGSFKYSNIVEVSYMKPAVFELDQNYPNPFNPTTIIQYSIPNAEHVTLKVYDILGKEVSTLVNENKAAGSYSVQLSAENIQLATGVYFYRLQAGSFTAIKKLLYLK